MRKFYLENSIGERWDLNDKSSFFWEPKGLGVSNKMEYESLGNGFRKKTFDEQEQINIVGEIAFTESHYSDYKSLIDWMHQGYTLSFIQCPLTVEYYCDVDIDYIEKEEIKDGYLAAPVSFLGKTAWYKKNPNVLNFALDDETEYMIFDYPMESYFALSNSSNSVDITPGGHYPAEIMLTAYGEISDPVFTLTNKGTGEELGRLELEGLTIDSGDYLKYTTLPVEPNDYSICKVAADGTKTDLSSYLSMSNENFFNIPVGVPCTLKLEFLGESSEATLYVYEFYRTV